MSLKYKLAKLDEKIAALTAEQRKSGMVVVLREFHAKDMQDTGLSSGDDYLLKPTSYRDHEGRTWPLDHTKWPKVYGGKLIVLREVYETPSTLAP